jgi:hypothetical protein
VSVEKELIGKDVSQKFLYGTIHWVFHMISDMAGSSASPGAGTGLPGPLLSLLKEISALPMFKNKDEVRKLSLLVSKLFNGTLLAEHDENGRIIKDTVKQFDLRAEIGVGYEVGRQTIPVLINECVVRASYLLRRLYGELKEKRSLESIEWKNVKPWGNPTVSRMLTIAAGTLTFIDLSDAAIRAGINAGKVAAGDPVTASAVFLSGFFLRINYVGVARFSASVFIEGRQFQQIASLKQQRLDLWLAFLREQKVSAYLCVASSWIELKKSEDVAVLLKDVTHNALRAELSEWDQIEKSGMELEQIIAELSDASTEFIRGLLE